MRHEHEDELRTHIVFLNPNEYNYLKKCSSSNHMKQNITFTIQRDDSSHDSFIRYRRLDNGKDEIFEFNVGNSDHTIVVYDGDSLTCSGHQSLSSIKCNQLEVGKPVRAFIYEIDFNPRSGQARKNEWSRSKYTVSAILDYGIAKECKGIIYNSGMSYLH